MSDENPRIRYCIHGMDKLACDICKPPSELAPARGSATEIIEDLIRACGSGMNWMDQVSRAKLGSATRGILTTDMGMCSSAIFKARQYLEKANSPNVKLCEGQRKMTLESPTDVARCPSQQRMVRPELRFKSATNEWATPDDLWKPLNDEFGFTLDVCSTHENAKCANHYTLTEDGLAQPWSGVCWMNPPYGAQLARWVKKCHDEARRGALVVGLIPVRSNTSYWHNYVMGAEIRFVRGYPKFGNAKQGLKAPLAVVVWRPNNAQAERPAGGNHEA